MYKVFLADDEIWEIMGLKKLIEKTGLPVKVVGEAVNGIEAIEGIQKSKPDILLTDIRMPGLDGLALAEQIQKKMLHTKVVFISGYAEFEYARKAIQMKVSGYLLKPVELEELKRVLETVIAELKEISSADDADSLLNDDLEKMSTIQRVIQDIQKSYMEDITLASLAEKYNLSTGYLSIQLKEYLGEPFSKYLTSLRVLKAQELLADEKLSVEQISEAVGYKDYFYFTKVFKKATGSTPSKYRKKLRMF